MAKSKLLLFVGLSLITGFIWGQVFIDIKYIYRPNTVTVDVVKEGDEILIYEHYSGKLVFEYSKNKGIDKGAYTEFEDAWEEVKSLD